MSAEERVCEGCSEEGHTDTDYDRCVESFDPDGRCECPVRCMDNYEPTDEQLWGRARAAIPTGGFR